MKEHLKPLMSSKKHDWVTPPPLIELVKEVFGGEIELDPCTTEANPVGANHIYTPETNGLEQDWAVKSTYVNSPYGREIAEWTDKCITEAYVEHNHGTLHNTVIQLVPARTDTKWFKRAALAAGSICFWEGRLHFIDPLTGEPAKYWCKKTQKWKEAVAPFPSALLLYPWNSEYNQLFDKVFKNYGTIMSI